MRFGKRARADSGRGLFGRLLDGAPHAGDDLVGRIRARTSEPRFEPARAEAIADAEESLDFALPRFLKRVLCEVGNGGSTRCTPFESLVIGVAVLPAALFWQWHWSWPIDAEWLRVILLAMSFLPAYLLFATSLMAVSAFTTRALGWRPKSYTDARFG